MIFYQQKMSGTLAVEQKEERKRVESVRQFCEGCCLWYSRECEDLRKRNGGVRSRINAWRQELFYDIGWLQCVDFSVRNRVNVNVYAFKMAARKFEVKSIRSYPG